MLKLIKVSVVVALALWFVLVTSTVLSMPPLEYGWQVWAIIACGPIVVVAGLWEVITRINRGRSK